MTNLIVFSVLFLCSCASVKRPDALICGVNAKAMKLRCYNIQTDFTDEGDRKPDAVATEISIISLQSLNGGIFLSPKDFEQVKVWIGDMRDYAKEHCK